MEEEWLPCGQEAADDDGSPILLGQPAELPSQSIVPEEAEELHLIYKIEGEPDEVDVFELSRVLDSLGTVLRESNRIINRREGGELVVKVKPFQPGSFIMDMVLQVQQNPGLFMFLTQPEAVKQVKEVLEYIGLIKKAGEVGASLLELLKRLKNGKPEKVEKRGDQYEYHATDGSTTSVSAPVHNLYNNGTVNNFIYNIAAPATRPDVEGIKTYLHYAEEATGVRIGKEEVEAIRAYSDPGPLAMKPEIIENTVTLMLHPKAGNYGENTGQWTFRIAGTNRTLKAKITDQNFMANYTTGIIRFYAADLLKARVHEKQTVEGSKVTVTNEIVEVLEYRPAHISARV